jgi:hypothetical protein
MAYFNFIKILSQNIFKHYAGDTGQNTKALVLKSGLVLSIQASNRHYCWPSETIDYSLYESFEVGFPSYKVDILMPYAEDATQPTETVYANVPRSVIKNLIDKHGGIVGTSDWKTNTLYKFK